MSTISDADLISYLPPELALEAYVLIRRLSWMREELECRRRHHDFALKDVCESDFVIDRLQRFMLDSKRVAQ